ncbi:MAG: hypothetical protein KA354_11740 [Phycisphaerae bacterium]|nr:hypothetical protein [Phycisphaerae bacterium]
MTRGKSDKVDGMCSPFGRKLMLVAATLVAAVTIVRADYFLISSVDLGADFGPAGNNPMCITFDGVYAYLGGYNGSGLSREIGILKVNLANPTDKAELAAAKQTVDTFRYYGALVVRNGVLYALLDRPSGNDVATTNVRAIDVTTGALVETFDGDNLASPGNGMVVKPAGMTAPAIGGMAYDPGYGGTDMGLAIFGFGSGRRVLLDIDSGATLHTQASGFIVWGGSSFKDSTSWKDCWFDTNGDVYQRRSNQVQRAIRTGGNSAGSIEQLTDALKLEDGTPVIEPGDGKPVATRLAPEVVGQNLALLNSGGGAGAEDLVVFNDRPDPRYVPPPLSFASTIKLIKKNGDLPPTPVQFLKADGTPLDPAADTPDGNGVYDFHYEAAQDLLLISDFSNRRLLVFQGVPPAPGACCLPSGECVEVNSFECQAQDGSFMGADTTCAEANCPQPCPKPFADGDRDQDVDQVDFGLFQLCYTGAEGGVPEGCACFDKNTDGAVDAVDLQTFVTCWSGPAVAANPDCAAN